PGQVLKIPSARSMLNSGVTSEMSGNIAISSDIPMSTCLPGNRSRATAYAASEASTTEMKVAIRPIPIEFSSGRVNSEEVKIPLEFSHVQLVGQKVARPVAAIVAGFLKDSETIHSTGMSTSRIVTMFAAIQPDFCLVVAAISAHLPPNAAPGAAA